MQDQHATPPSSFTQQPLTPPPTDKKPSAEARRVITLFRHIQAGRDTGGDTWAEFQLATGEFDQLQSTLQQDGVLSGFVKDKIRYDYDEENCRLVVRMPSAVHELFIDGLEDEIRSQLKAIRGESDGKAQFAQKVRAARSTEIRFAANASSSQSKYEPDASFGHIDAQYPGVVIEVAYSQKKKRLGRLAENYLLDSDASVRVVVGLDIEYGKDSCKATLSIWRPELSDSPSGPELRAVDVVADKAFRDEKGNPVEHPGLRLRLSDFACEELVQEEMGDDDTEVCISGIQLCQYLAAAESKVQRAHRKHSLPDKVKKRKRSSSPLEEIMSSDEAKYTEQERRAMKRMKDDIDYEDRSSNKSLSE